MKDHRSASESLNKNLQRLREGLQQIERLSPPKAAEIKLPHTIPTKKNRRKRPSSLTVESATVELERATEERSAKACRRPLDVQSIIDQDARKQAKNKILSHLKETTGLEASDSLKKKLDLYLKDKSPEALKSEISLLAVLPWTHQLWRTITEHIIVPETYFFRDRFQIEMLRRQIIPQIIEEQRQKNSPQIHIWSAATSTGEESYTLAILTLEAMLKAGVARERKSGEIVPHHDWSVKILGTDISNRSLSHAKAGIYRRSGRLNAFRNFSPTYSRFFKFRRTPNGPDVPLSQAKMGRIRSFVRPIVHFSAFNLQEKSPPATDFNLVLCRNVLIYFDNPTKRNVQKLLWQSLLPGATLALGACDSMLIPQYFSAHVMANAICYEKRMKPSD
ncbi:CheR family methyltransferase [Magnetococcales bacterium HHB-1]